MIGALAERILLIAEGLSLEAPYLEKIWELLRYLVFGPIENSNQTFLQNICLDSIVLLTFYHVIQVNKLCKTLVSILEVYSLRVAFEFPLNREALISFYNKTFKGLLVKECKNINLVLPKLKLKGENPNSTPVHTSNEKQRQLLQPPLRDGLFAQAHPQLDGLSRDDLIRPLSLNLTRTSSQPVDLFKIKLTGSFSQTP